MYYAARCGKEGFGRISGELDMANEKVHICRPPLSLQTSESNVNRQYYIDKFIQWDYRGGSTTRPLYKINITLLLGRLNPCDYTLS